jgi:hypothetical protein
MATLIGVYKSQGGLLATIRVAVLRAVGLPLCDLSRISHQLGGEKPQWRRLQKRLAEELGHRQIVVFPQTAPAVYAQASTGREPCVLIEDDEGRLGMILDWNDLALAKGSVAQYEKILRSKLLMY